MFNKLKEIALYFFVYGVMLGVSALGLVFLHTHDVKEMFGPDMEKDITFTIGMLVGGINCLLAVYMVQRKG